MSLLKIFWNLPIRYPDVHADPLAHPALAAMSERQLADLPFPRPEPAAAPATTEIKVELPRRCA